MCQTSCSVVIGGALIKKKGLRELTVENGAIPPEFGVTDSTLVCIIRNRNGYDKHMKKHVANEYHGKHTFATWDEVDAGGEYGDVDSYRYVFSGDIREIDGGDNGPFMNTKMTTESFYIYDRKDAKTYRSPFTSSFFAKVIQAYVINLEKERVKGSSSLQVRLKSD